MKKSLLFCGAMFFTLFNLDAQTQVAKGNFIIDPYIGIPNWGNAILYNQYDGELAYVENYKVNGGLLSYGGRLEYLLADKLGIGADINYELSGYNYDYQESVNSYNVDYKAKKLRAMLRFNYHFVQNERIDVYTGFAGGYKYVNRSFTSQNPDDPNRESGAIIPVAVRISIGTRIYITNNIGGMLELGAFGGSLLQFGVSAKF
jgi:hypothetical protein